MVYSNGDWHWSVISNLVPHHIALNLVATMPHVPGGGCDITGWATEASRKFSVRSAYQLRVGPSVGVPDHVWSVISKYRGLPRIHMFLWTICNNRILINAIWLQLIQPNKVQEFVTVDMQSWILKYLQDPAYFPIQSGD
ncbi:hypothetical protein V6N13_004813 [Hibiscus sabdariffa]|uniref:Reverse transcriptase zinc-binding domain-containing protein n=1 Tax=Hibiscus sabdariffa TaxID=183260 RepID=A0ABR2S0F3_9ROSI